MFSHYYLLKPNVTIFLSLTIIDHNNIISQYSKCASIKWTGSVVLKIYNQFENFILLL